MSREERLKDMVVIVASRSRCSLSQGSGDQCQTLNGEMNGEMAQNEDAVTQSSADTRKPAHGPRNGWGFDF